MIHLVLIRRLFQWKTRIELFFFRRSQAMVPSNFSGKVGLALDKLFYAFYNVMCCTLKAFGGFKLLSNRAWPFPADLE